MGGSIKYESIVKRPSEPPTKADDRRENWWVWQRFFRFRVLMTRERNGFEHKLKKLNTIYRLQKNHIVQLENSVLNRHF